VEEVVVLNGGGEGISTKVSEHQGVSFARVRPGSGTSSRVKSIGTRSGCVFMLDV
jgi:hypothetical protein